MRPSAKLQETGDAKGVSVASGPGGNLQRFRCPALLRRSIHICCELAAWRWKRYASWTEALWRRSDAAADWIQAERLWGRRPGAPAQSTTTEGTETNSQNSRPRVRVVAWLLLQTFVGRSLISVQ